MSTGMTENSERRGTGKYEALLARCKDMPAVPTINLNDEMSLARTAVALRPKDFDDAGRAAVVEAIARGRDRVKAAGADPRAVLTLAEEVAAPIVVRNALPWTLSSMPAAAPLLFSLRDLLWLGHPAIDRDALARWGVVADAVDEDVVRGARDLLAHQGVKAVGKPDCPGRYGDRADRKQAIARGIEAARLAVEHHPTRRLDRCAPEPGHSW